MILELTLAAVITANTGTAALNMKQLEDLYWQCDSQYMRGLIAPDDMLPCIGVYEEFKQRRFGGDFDRFLEYWRANRLREWQLRGYTHQD